MTYCGACVDVQTVASSELPQVRGRLKNASLLICMKASAQGTGLHKEDAGDDIDAHDTHSKRYVDNNHQD